MSNEFTEVERSIAYQPKLDENGDIDFSSNRDSSYFVPFDFNKEEYNRKHDKAQSGGWYNPVSWFTGNDSTNVDRLMRDLNFSFDDYGDKSKSTDTKANGTKNGKMTFVLTAEQKAQYDAGQMPVGLDPLNPRDWSSSDGGKSNFSANEANKMMDYMRKEVENGGCVVQLDRESYEKAFGVPYVEPISYQNDKQFGDAIKGAHALRPGAQIFLLTDAEIRDIRNGKGFTAIPTNLAYDQTEVDKQWFKSASAELGAAANGAMTARSDVKLYMFTPEEIAMYNGRNKSEVIEETLLNEEKQKEIAKQNEWEASWYGKLAKFISEITSTIGGYANKAGSKLNDLIGGDKEQLAQDVSDQPKSNVVNDSDRYSKNDINMDNSNGDKAKDGLELG